MVIIIGDEELRKNIVVVKDMASSEQIELPISDILNYFSKHP